jgi:hypothetical protein
MLEYKWITHEKWSNSRPYTSQQKGRAERTLHTINNIVRSLIFQASLPLVYWADSLHTATYLLNRHPTKTLDSHTTYFALHGTQPSYTHLRVFGYACYPNLSSTAPHKLSPHSSLCVFLGYSSDHRAIGVLTFTLRASSSLDMLCLMRWYFPSLICPPHPRITPPLNFWMTLIIPLHPVGQEMCMQVLDFLAAWMPPQEAQAVVAIRQHPALHRLVPQRPPRHPPRLLLMAPLPPSPSVVLPLRRIQPPTGWCLDVPPGVGLGCSRRSHLHWVHRCCCPYERPVPGCCQWLRLSHRTHRRHSAPGNHPCH